MSTIGPKSTLLEIETLCQVDCDVVVDGRSAGVFDYVCEAVSQTGLRISCPSSTLDPNTVKISTQCGFKYAATDSSLPFSNCMNRLTKAACPYTPYPTNCLSVASQTSSNDPTLKSLSSSSQLQSPSPSPSPSTISKTASSEGSASKNTGALTTASTKTGGREATNSSSTIALSTSSSSGNSTFVHVKSDGLSSGAAAGVGIGSAIAGAIFASVILCFLFIRYKKRHQHPVRHAGHLPNYQSDIGGQEKGQQRMVETGVTIVENYLPQPAEDDAITGEMSRLRDKIKDHVQSFYHESPVNSRSFDLSLLNGIAKATGIEVTRIQDLLLKPQSRMVILRLYLAWTILSRCVGHILPGTSLLPEEVAAFAASMVDISHTDTRKVALASKWKVISGALLQSRSGLPQPAEGAQLGRSIKQTLSDANAVLAHFIGPSPNATSDKRLRNLESIVRRATQLALLLFSQPSNWALDWTAGSGSVQGRLVVFPGLLETVTDGSVAQQPPRLFQQPEVVAVQ